jgi:hypothetical protein
MKKLLIVLFVLILTTKIIALDLSIGGGGLFAAGFDEMSGLSMDTDPWFGRTFDKTELDYGGYIFFDAEYIEIDFSIYGNRISYEVFDGDRPEFGKLYNASVGDKIGSGILNGTSLGIELYGKYPIEIKNKFLFFPLFGLDAQIFLSMKDNELDSHFTDFSALWVRAGAGLDFPIFNKVFIRGEVLWGLRFNNKMENDYLSNFTWSDNFSQFFYGSFNHGFKFKLAIGYKI